MDHINPISEATNLAGTALGSFAIACFKEPIVALIFFALDRDTWNVNDARSTIVPNVLMAWRGKKEHLSICKDKPRLADSYTIRIDILRQPINDLTTDCMSSI